VCRAPDAATAGSSGGLASARSHEAPPSGGLGTGPEPVADL